MTIENDIDVLVSDVTTRKAAVVKAKGDLDAIVAEGASAAGQAEGAALAALSARDETSAMATASGALATASVGATAYADLAAVAASKVEDAVDVFIYDTSLDSDGGAWRYRTQGTSWYREPLNTATRGSRREFPAVAVIVVTPLNINIYDGDDPSLPMWMILAGGASGAGRMPLIAGGYYITSVVAAEAEICAAHGTGLFRCNFVSDSGLNHEGAPYSPIRFTTNIAQRSAAEFVIDSALPQLIHRAASDVAITALPDAPIDPATGLPVPTIAVATAGGVSVIKDDGAVVDLTKLVSGSVNASRVVFLEDGGIAWSSRDVNRYIQVLNAIPDADYAGDPDRLYSEGDQPAPGTDLNLLNLYAANHLVDGACAGGDGLTLLAERPDAPEQGMVAYTTKDYATGWMPGAIKGAWLADTDEGDLTGFELVKNGGFDVDADWILGSETSISNGTINFNWTTFAGMAQQPIALRAGQTYRLRYDVTARTSGTFRVYLGAYITGTSIVGSVDVFFTPASDVTNISFQGDGNGFVGSVDNFSITEAGADRSVNAKGLIVHGRVRRAPVADSAELVAYSGFSADNYLEQPYNADLDFGTGDFAVMGWAKPQGDNLCIASYENAADGYGWSLLRGSGQLRLYTGRGVYNKSYSFGAIPDASWQMVHVIRRNGLWYGGVNGLTSRVGIAGAFDNFAIGNTLKVGLQSLIAGGAWGGDLALLRITGTPPSADQIARIYNDERALFEPGAACTLYGASDAVTALAHDKVTNLLHVGTSAGRSVFDGLRRVAHTTQPVANAIAAHNGLIIED